MSNIDFSSPSGKRDQENRLKRLRRHAARQGLDIWRGFRGHGSFTVVVAGTDRPRSVDGLVNVPLEKIEAALFMPLRDTPRSIGDSAIDRFIARAGVDHVLARLDAMTKPQPFATAAE